MNVKDLNGNLAPIEKLILERRILIDEPFCTARADRRV